MLLALALLFLWPDPAAAPSVDGGSAGSSADPHQTQAQPHDRSNVRKIELEPSKPPAREPEPSDARAARERLRASILAQQARAAEAKPAHAAEAKPARVDPSTPEAAPSGQLRNRIGGHEPLLARLNEDFMPLADECIEAARERDPDLAGMLAVNFEILSDEALGSIVETVEFAEQDEVTDEELHTCIRETTLSMILPEAPSGREQFMLTIPIE
jgi:hypothetical protein